jgi:hypothetical protein
VEDFVAQYEVANADDVVAAAETMPAETVPTEMAKAAKATTGSKEAFDAGEEEEEDADAGEQQHKEADARELKGEGDSRYATTIVEKTSLTSPEDNEDAPTPTSTRPIPPIGVAMAVTPIPSTTPPSTLTATTTDPPTTTTTTPSAPVDGVWIAPQHDVQLVQTNGMLVKESQNITAELKEMLKNMPGGRVGG